MKTPLVHVVWADAYSTDAWTRLTELGTDVSVCHSVGFLVSRSAKSIVVAGTVSEDGEACCVMHIPKGMVMSITKVNVGDVK